MRRALAGKDLGDSHLVGVLRRRAGCEQGGNLRSEIGRDDLVGIEIEQPIVAALLLGEALLLAVARPGVEDDTGAERFGQRLRAVGRAGIDDHDIVA